MHVTITLCWGSKKIEKQYRFPQCRELFLEYTNRIKKFIPCDVKVTTLERFTCEPSDHVWLCHGHAKAVASESLSNKFEQLQNIGVKNLNILIGPPDGFTKDFLQKHSSAFLWSFGPMTLPHELASVVACEQIYRAITILNGHPYHLGHV